MSDKNLVGLSEDVIHVEGTVPRDSRLVGEDELLQSAEEPEGLDYLNRLSSRRDRGTRHHLSIFRLCYLVEGFLDLES